MTEVRIRNLDKALHSGLKISAIKQGLTMEELLKVLIKQHIERSMEK